jgi:hypothetical protein
VGALVTTCGLLSGILPIAAVGVTAMASGIVLPAHARIDKGSEIELSEMFFLWKALDHAE